MARGIPVLAGSVATLFSEYDLVLVNYGAWYHLPDREELIRDLDDIMGAIAVMNKEPGRAGAFISMTPMHFPTVDGGFLMDVHRE